MSRSWFIEESWRNVHCTNTSYNLNSMKDDVRLEKTLIYTLFIYVQWWGDIWWVIPLRKCLIGLISFTKIAIFECYKCWTNFGWKQFLIYLEAQFCWMSVDSLPWTVWFSHTMMSFSVDKVNALLPFCLYNLGRVSPISEGKSPPILEYRDYCIK